MQSDAQQTFRLYIAMAHIKAKHITIYVSQKKKCTGKPQPADDI